MRLKFGTDGWRGIMGEDFTFSAVAVVGTALGKYVSQTAGGRSVLIGYDNRRDSERYAAITAGELKASGLHVILSREPIPTPVLAVAVRKHQAAGAVMITASHNPPVFNGLKFMPDYAGPALPDVTAAIEAHIADATTPGLPVVDAESLGRSCTGDLAAGYEEAITNVLAPASSLAGLKVVVDAMHGVGASYLPRLLKKAGAEVALLRGNRDPEFGGGNPEPIEAELNLLSDTVRKTGADLGLATDGDADRFGVIDRGGRYLSPNEVLTILYEYLLRTGRRSGGVARTVATTAMLDRVAAAYGQAVTETPVGFKYIGQALRSGVAVFGGEESGGLSLSGHVPEKDGILAGLMVAGVAAENCGRSLNGQLDAIGEKYGRLYSLRVDVPIRGADGAAELKTRLAGLKPLSLGGESVVESLEIDGKKLVLASGASVLVRPSGTEPLVRIYAEAGESDEARRLASAAARLLAL